MKKIYLILTAALIFRLINLNQSLWLDESINVIYSQKYNFWDFLTIYSLGDFHPPLYFAILWLWTHIFGTSEIIVRLPSVILGVLTVLFTYLIGKNLFNQKTALVSALILALNPLHIYYSQEARMYSLAAFSVTFSFWALINLLKNKKYFGLIYGLSTALILYSDYLVYFALITQLIYIVWQEKAKLPTTITSMILGGVIWSPWLLIFPTQLKTGQTAASQIPGWAGVVGGANLKELALLAVKSIIGRVSIDNKYIYAAIVAPVLLLYSYIIQKTLRDFSKETKLVFCWAVIPVVLAFLVSFYLPIFAYFRMIFILPAVALLTAKGIGEFKSKPQKLLIAVILLISSVFLLMYYLNTSYQRENWKEAVGFANQTSTQILFEDANLPAPAQYYNCQNCQAALINFPANDESGLVDLQKLLSGTNKVYLFDYLVEISDPNRLVSRKLEELGYKNTQTKNFDGVGFIYEYSK